MGVSRWEQLAPLSGAAFAVLYFVGFGLIGEVGRTSTPTSEEILDLLTDGASARLIGAYLSLVALALLLWFAGSIRAMLRAAEGGLGRLSAVAFGGAVVAAAALLVGFAAIGQATIRADSSQGLGSDAAVVFYDLYRSTLTASGIGFAVLVGATSVVAYRTDVFPSWLVWSSAVLAVGLVSPLFFFFGFFGVIWVLVVSIWLFRNNREATVADNRT